MDWKKKKYNTISIFRARPFDIVINFWDEGGENPREIVQNWKLHPFPTIEISSFPRAKLNIWRGGAEFINNFT